MNKNITSTVEYFKKLDKKRKVKQQRAVNGVRIVSIVDLDTPYTESEFKQIIPYSIHLKDLVEKDTDETEPFDELEYYKLYDQWSEISDYITDCDDDSNDSFDEVT